MAQPRDSVYSSVTAVVDPAQLEDKTISKTELEHALHKHGMIITKTENGYQIKGTLTGICQVQGLLSPPEWNDPFLEGDENVVAAAQEFMNGQSLGTAKSVKKTSNLKYEILPVLYALTDRRELIMELLNAQNASLKLKDFNEGTIRLRLEDPGSDEEVTFKTDIESILQSTMVGLKLIDFKDSSGTNPRFYFRALCHKGWNPKLFFASNRYSKEGCFISVLTWDRFHKDTKALIRDLIAEQNANNASLVFQELSEYREPNHHSQEAAVIVKSKSKTRTVKSKSAALAPVPNGVRASEPRDASMDQHKQLHGTENGGDDLSLTKSVSLTMDDLPKAKRDVFIGDSDVVEYLFTFYSKTISEIEKKYEIIFEVPKKGAEVVSLRPVHQEITMEKINNGELALTHLAQDIIQEFRTEHITITGVPKELVDRKFEYIKDEAKRIGFFLRKEDSNRLFIFGPGEHHKECKKIVRAALSIHSDRGRTFVSNEGYTSLTSSVSRHSDSTPSLGAGPSVYQTGVENQSLHYNDQRLSPIPNDPHNKAFMTKDTKITILIWRADITQLHVDAIVNAADSHLSNVTGIGLSISKAGGDVIRQDCERYIKNYGSLEVSKVCTTPSGLMPSKEVFHAAGPQWDVSEDKSECSKMLYDTFFQCLELAHNRNYESVAFPAISDMFGIPKEIVSDMASKAILVFNKKYPFSTVIWIHLVNILPESVVLFQTKFKENEKDNFCFELSSFKSYARWLTGKPLDTASSMTKQLVLSDIHVETSVTSAKPNLHHSGQHSGNSRSNRFDSQESHGSGLQRKGFSTKGDHLTVLIWRADITKLHVDAIVNAANSKLEHIGGVAYAIQRAAGYELEKESRDHISRHGEVLVGSCIVTTSGNLPAKKVIHAVGPMWSSYPDKLFCWKMLYEAFFCSLCLADSIKCSSIALPAISSGIYGVPKTVVAECAMQAVCKFNRQFPTSILRWIHLVDITSESVIAFQEIFDTWGNKNSFYHLPEYNGFDSWYMPYSTHDVKEVPSAYQTREAATTTLPAMDVRPKEHSNRNQTGKPVQKRETDVDQATGNIYQGRPEDRASANDRFLGQSLESRKATEGQASFSEVVKRPPSEHAAVHSGRSDKALLKTNDNHNDRSKVVEKGGAGGEPMSKEEDDNCSVCLSSPTNPVTLDKCKHTFCKECLDQCFKKVAPKCPNCGLFYGEMTGKQPKNGTMTVKRSSLYLSGYERYGSIEINYKFPNGIQEKHHPNPGKPYSGTQRRAFLPDNDEGNKVLKLLQRAFKARLIFTVGKSVTSGADNCVVWNCIHHKTTMYGGSSGYGYPDPTYLSRVQLELADQGIK